MDLQRPLLLLLLLDSACSRWCDAQHPFGGGAMGSRQRAA
eukprot:COSAG01_NODE_36833_length_512_cov_0.782082_1_plen_39_part_01